MIALTLQECIEQMFKSSYYNGYRYKNGTYIAELVIQAGGNYVYIRLHIY